MVGIERVKEAKPEVLKSLAWLLPQLNPNLPVPTMERLKEIIADPSVTLLFAWDQRDIVGTATVIVYTTPFWIKARIEDVVVDKASRGQGAGRALVNACLEVAREKGAQVAELQSRKSREAANRLYQRMGFELRDSNLYRLVLR
jgi:ribosomal protein S18 acetylase RimI-like enzyme